MKSHSFRFIFLLIAFITINNFVFAQNSTGINNPNPNKKASLDIRTTTGFKQGFLMPRLAGKDTTAIGAIKGQDHGLMFFDTLIGDVRFWDGNKWKGGGGNGNASSIWSKTGTSIFQSVLTDNVGIGTNSPIEILEVVSNIRLRNKNGTSTVWALETSEAGGLEIIDRKIDQRKMIFNDNGDIYMGAVPINVTGTSSAMTILKAGNVGIGTLTPKNKLDINGSTVIGTYAGTIEAPANSLLISGNLGVGFNTADSRILVNYVSQGSNIPSARIYQHNCGTACNQKNGSAIQLINDNQTGPDQGAVLSFADPINVTNKDDGAASIALVNRKPDIGQGGLAFRTRNAAGILAERMRITAEGNVGIGVDAPLSTLHVNGPIATKVTNVSTANYTILEKESIVIKNTNGPSIYTLPAVVDGKTITIINNAAMGANNIIIASPTIITGNFTVTPKTFNVCIGFGVTWMCK